MTETPKCPYCGEKMALKVREEPKNKWNARYICNKCHSTGPYANECQEKSYAEEVALAYTLHRAEPENRLLTLGEAQQISSEYGGTWLEEKTAWGLAHITPIDNQTGACYIYTFFAKFPLMAEKYGKTWRCWLRKPTTEQMAAAKWEE